MLVDREKLGHVLVDQIVCRDCYGLQSLRSSGAKIHTILDIGANAGVFALTARVLFPEARIICIEPCPSTFERLVSNVRFHQIQCHCLALSGDPYVSIQLGADSGSNSTGPATKDGGVNIRGATLEQIVSEYDIKVDGGAVIKVDCEGGERTIIESEQDTEILKRFGHFAFELHYGDGRGAKKWANAPSRETAEQWVSSLDVPNRYYRTRLGGMLWGPIQDTTSSS